MSNTRAEEHVYESPEDGFRILIQRYEGLAGVIGELRLENAQQHGQVEAKLASLEAEVHGLRESTAAEIRALQSRLNDILIKGIKDANDKIIGKDKVIKVLSYVITVLVGIIIGDKFRLVEILKNTLGG